MTRDELIALKDARRAAFHNTDPCPTCENGGTVVVGVGPIDGDGNQDTTEIVCPACGPELLAGIDALSRAALADGPEVAS